MSHGKIKWLGKKCVPIYKETVLFQILHEVFTCLGCVLILVEDLILKSQEDFEFFFPSPSPSHQKGQKPGIPKHFLDFRLQGI